MTWIDCPHGWQSVAKLGKTVTLIDRRVHICGGICDCADLCGIAHCRFYDLSRDATRRFQRANADAHTLDGMLLRQRFPDIDLAADYEQRRAAWKRWDALDEPAPGQEQE